MAKPAIPNFDATDHAFHAEAVRGFIHKTALETLEQMTEQGIENGHIAVMTGLLEAAVQVWCQASIRAGVPPQKARETMERQVQRFWLQWRRAEEQAAPAVVAS